MVDLNKPIRTVGGLAARVLCTDYKGYLDFPVLAAVTSKETGKEAILQYRPSGEYSIGSNSFDLVNIPEERSYFRVYKGKSLIGSGLFYSLEGGREHYSDSDIIEYVEVDGKLERVVLHKA